MITQANTAGVGPAPPRRQLLGVALGGLILAACRPKAGPVRVRIGYQKSGVLLLAKARGGLEAALAGVGPVAVEWIEFVAGPPMLEAMRAGAIDIGAVGDTPPIFAQAAGAPIVYAAAVPDADAAEAIITPANSPIKQLAQIKGAKVGLTKGSSSHLLLIEALRSVGLSMTDIKPTYLAPPDAAVAFANGAIDAWAIWDPYLALAQRRGLTRALITRGALPHSSSFILAYRGFAERAPAVLGAVLDFLAVESDWSNAHVDEAAQIMSARTGIPYDVTLTAMRRAPFAITPLTPAIVQRQQAAADVFRHQGFIPARVSVGDAVWTGWRRG
jgi:sulfonate transport system substrate-binding protein